MGVINLVLSKLCFESKKVFAVGAAWTMRVNDALGHLIDGCRAKIMFVIWCRHIHERIQCVAKTDINHDALADVTTLLSNIEAV